GLLPPTTTLFPYTTLFRSLENIRSWLSQEKKQWRALLFLFSESNDEDEETIERAPKRQVFWKRHEDERWQAMVRQSDAAQRRARDRKSTRLNSSHDQISYA